MGAEKLLSEFGPSLLSGLNSHSILNAARNNQSCSWSQSNKMCELLLAKGALSKQESDTRKEGIAKHAETNEKPAAPRSGRSASVPHVWAHTQPVLSAPKRSGSNTSLRV